ncbi:unnamed protein product, partial [Prorocentrum cordatum]
MAGGRDQLAADLRFLLEEKEVSEELQDAMARWGYTTVNRFALLDDDRARVRALLARDFGLDTTAPPPAGPNNRLAIVKVIDAWETACRRAEEERKQEAEAKSARLPKLIGKATHLSMRRADGALEDCIAPGAALVKQVMEMIEESNMEAIPLTQAVSFEDGDDTKMGAVVAVSGTMRWRCGRTEVGTPHDPEAFRKRMRTLAFPHVYARLRRPGRVAFQSATVALFTDYVKHLLGDHARGLVSKGHARLINFGKPFGVALKDAMNDASLRGRHFVTPVAVADGGGRQRGRAACAAHPGRHQRLTVARVRSLPKPSIKECLLEALAADLQTAGAAVEVVEVDALNDASRDLLDSDARLRYLQDVSGGLVDVVITAPPCGTFSRSMFANRQGPPLGFPWLEGAAKLKVQNANVLGLFLEAQILEAVIFARSAAGGGRRARGLMEFPEPASLWQLPQFRCIARPGAGFLTFAFHRAEFDVEYSKPMRILTDMGALAAGRAVGWPDLDSEGHYRGPLGPPPACARPLVSADGKRKAELARAAAYPIPMNQWIAQAIKDECLVLLDPLRAGALVGGGPPPRSARHSPRRISESLTEDVVVDAYASHLKSAAPLRALLSDLRGKRLVCHCRPQERCHGDAIVEAYGKLSGEALDEGKPGQPGKTGRWALAARRPPASSIASERREALDRATTDLEGIAAAEQQRRGRARPPLRACLLERASGLFDGGIFPAVVVAKLKALWHVRLLEAVAKAFGDPDHQVAGWAAAGVPLGVDAPLPRTPAVCERKAKWALPDVKEEVFVSGYRWADNYASVKERPEVIIKYLEEEVAAGRIIRITMREAKRRWPERLRVAAFGAVQKAAGLGEWRVVFDATHHVLVNHQIKIRDQVRLPVWQDIAALLEAIHALGEPVRFALLYDIAKAHRQIPVREEDWGWQACCSPAASAPGLSDDDKEIHVNMVSTFGVTSAGDWASVFGLITRADDGLLMAVGAGFERKLLAALPILVTLGAPLAPKKLRGGIEIDWVGCRVHIREYLLGVSELSLKWAVELIERRGMRSFVPTLRDRSEISRIDATADGDFIVLGGWATGPSPDPGKARWFSHVLGKEDIPWAHERGDPFRVVASLELMAAVYGVVFLLDPAQAMAGGRGRISFSAGTDSQGNSGLVRKWLTTMWPLCAVAMELGSRLAEADLDLDLAWRRRDINVEADALTNEKFEGFDMGRRVDSTGVLAELNGHAE